MKTYLPNVRPEQFRELMSLLSAVTDREHLSLRGLEDACFTLRLPVSLTTEEWELMQRWIESCPYPGSSVDAYPLSSACVAMAYCALASARLLPESSGPEPLERGGLVTCKVAISETSDFWFGVQRFAESRGATLEGGIEMLVRSGLKLWAAGHLEVVH